MEMRADNMKRSPAFLLTAAVTKTFLWGFCKGQNSTNTTNSVLDTTPTDNDHLDTLVSDADFNMWMWIGCLSSGVGMLLTGIVVYCVNSGACSGHLVQMAPNPYLIQPRPSVGGKIPQIQIARPSLGGQGLPIRAPVKAVAGTSPLAPFRGRQPSMDSKGRRPSADSRRRRYSTDSRGSRSHRERSRGYSTDPREKRHRRRKKRRPMEDDSHQESSVDYSEIASEATSLYSGSSESAYNPAEEDRYRNNQ